MSRQAALVRRLARVVPVPTGRLAVVAAGIAPLAVFSPLGTALTLVLVNAALVGLAVVDAARCVRFADIVVERELPDALTLEHQGDVRWTVRNRSGRTLALSFADQLAPSLHPERRRVQVRVPPGGLVRAATTIRPSRRGRFPVRSLTLRARSPWGLASRQETREVLSELRVYPAFRSRKEAELRVVRAQMLHSGMRLAAGRGGAGEFDSLREYGVDDEFRHIDWAATARSTKAIVRTYRAERNQNVVLLVDSGRTMAGQVAVGEGRRLSGLADASWTVPRLDHAMDAAMMLTVVTTGLGDAAGMVAFADRVRAVLPPRARRDQLRRLTEALFPLDPVLAESDYRQAFAHTLSRFRRRALLVVLTELSPEPMAETLLPALPLVLRDHLVVVAGIRDPEVDRWANAVPGDSTTAYRKAAAVQSLSERHQAARKLRALGATVVDETPAHLPGALADAYLDVKLTGRL